MWSNVPIKRSEYLKVRQKTNTKRFPRNPSKNKTKDKHPCSLIPFVFVSKWEIYFCHVVFYITVLSKLRWRKNIHSIFHNIIFWTTNISFSFLCYFIVHREDDIGIVCVSIHGYGAGKEDSVKIISQFTFPISLGITLDRIRAFRYSYIWSKDIMPVIGFAIIIFFCLLFDVLSRWDTLEKWPHPQNRRKTISVAPNIFHHLPAWQAS